MIYRTANCEIDAQALSIKSLAGETFNIRPKTCKLLVLLLENAGKPISKQVLLDNVWAGSVVSDQVIFQSINEIRQLFPNEDVIKTIPKQGYLWLPTVSVQSSNVLKARSRNRLISAAVAMFAIVTIGLAMTFNGVDAEGDSADVLNGSAVSGSVIVLPIQNHIVGNDHSWITLGMMDQVIRRLPTSSRYGVLSTDYTFQVLKRASIDTDEVSIEQVPSIFRVSGAEFIVSSALTGGPNDYRLNYVFHFRDNQKQGVLFNGELQKLIDEYTTLISKQLDPQPIMQQVDYRADFNNALMSEAVNAQNESDHEQAISLLESIIANDMNNLTAHRLLINSLSRLKQFDEAAIRIDVALDLAKNLNDKQELAQFLYSKAMNFYVLRDDEKSSQYVTLAFEAAKEQKDWLLMAYVKDVQANIAINQQDYELVKRLYHEEKQYHQVLRCPVGEAYSWAKLARIAKWQNQPNEFESAIDKAITIAQSRELTSQLSYFSNIKEKGIL